MTISLYKGRFLWISRWIV